MIFKKGIVGAPGESVQGSFVGPSSKGTKVLYVRNKLNDF